MGPWLYLAQIEDCKAAIRWLRAHAAEYRIDPAHIGAWGASAGGRLVSLLRTTGNTREFDVGENLEQSSAVQCVIDWYGPTDFLHWGENPDAAPRHEPKTSALLGGAVETHEAEARRACPVDYVTAKAAPFLIMHGDQDPTVPPQQSRELNAALQSAGVESTLTIVPGARHGGPPFFTPENRELMLAFLNRHLQAPAVQ